jgi:hypothetical protein
MKNRWFSKIPFIGRKYPIQNFENLTMDLNSPYPITFDQTFGKSVSFQKYPFSSEKYNI